MGQLRPTFSESWYRVATLKARLRGSTQISRQHYRGDRWYVVRDPAGNQYHRLSAAAYKFVGLLDGTRTVGEAWDLVGGQLADDAPTQPEVIQILSQLHAANLLEANITADAGVLLRRHKQMQKRQMQGKLMNILFPRIPLWDPDRFLKTWMPVMRHVLSKFGAIIWLVVVIAACAKLAPYWEALKNAGKHAIDFQNNKANYISMFFVFVGIKLIHELGHAFTCRRFGGEVHELGIMFLVFVPAPYVDASSAWALPSKWAKAFVGAGGMIFELFVAAILAFVWIATKDGSYPLLAQICFNTMLIASVSTLVFNANPLLRYDGYYILSDLLEIPNLRQKAMEYSLGLIKRHIFGVKSSLPLPPAGQRVWLFLYAITSGAYRVLVGVTIILVVTNQVPVLGVLMALGGVVTWLVVPVAKISNYLLLEPELHRKRGRATVFVGAVVAAAVVMVGLVPFTVHYEAVGMVEPGENLQPLPIPLVAGGLPVPFQYVDALTYSERGEGLNARVTGTVEKILVRPGQAVKKGDPLLVCSDILLTTTRIHDKAECDALEAHARMVLPTDAAQYKIDMEKLRSDRQALAVLDEKIADLTLRAPVDGVVIAGNLDELQGKFLHQGEPTGITVAVFDNLQIFAIRDQSDAGLAYVRPETKAEVRLAGDRGKSIDGRVIRVMNSGTYDVKHAPLTNIGGEEAIADPSDKSGRKVNVAVFPVLVSIDNPDHKYFPGQRAYLRFETEKKPLAWQWGRRFWQLVQSHNAQNKWL